MFIAGQIVGVLVTVAAIVSLQFRDMKYVLASQVVANLLLMLNYALLDAWSGATIAIIATVQTLIMFFVRLTDGKIPEKSTTILTVILTVAFMVIFAYSSIQTYKGPVDILSMLASLIFCVCIAQKNAFLCRLFILINAALWIGYDIGTLAYTTIITHVLSLSSAAMGIIRLDLKKLKKHNSVEEEETI